jgi:membrane protein YdbS with pleckstrin-like domain
MNSYTIKPNHTSFFIFPFYTSLIIKLIACTIISLLIWIPLALLSIEKPKGMVFYTILAIVVIWLYFFISSLLKYISLTKRFNKTSWTITPITILWNTGGILFKYKKTILSNKMNHVAKRQGPLQKLTGIGSIHIATTGTSSFDMSITDLTQYNEWYTDLKKLSDN